MKKKSFLCKILPLMMAVMLCNVIISCGDDDDDPWDGGKDTEVVNNDSDGIAISQENFPDATFRSYLFQMPYGKDSIITKEEIKTITGIRILGTSAGGYIRSLQGIHHFTALKTIICISNQLEHLDVSKNPELTELYVTANKLTKLDVSHNPKLEKLGCAQNTISSLDVSQNPKLTELYCYENWIRGKAMDAFINSLPNNTTNQPYPLYIIGRKLLEDQDHNICTKAQVAAIKAKGWIPLYNSSNYDEYEGRDN